MQRAARQARRARRSAKAEQEEDGYIDEEQSPSSLDGEFGDVPSTLRILARTARVKKQSRRGGRTHFDKEPRSIMPFHRH